jgi:hypothetical protein
MINKFKGSFTFLIADGNNASKTKNAEPVITYAVTATQVHLADSVDNNLPSGTVNKSSRNA